MGTVESMVAAGIASERAGNVDAAVSNYRQALTLRPGDPQASLCFAQLLLRVRRPGEAAAVLRKAKAPQGEPAVKHMLGLALLEAGDVDEAVLELRKALAIAPDSPPILSNLGSAVLRAGDEKRAEELFRRALSIAPNDAMAKFRLAGLALYVGRREEARTLYREMLQAGERQAVIYAGLIEASDITEEPPEYSEVSTMAEDTSVSPPERRMLHFAAARVDRGLGRDDEAFRHYAAGKALLPPFDVGHFAEMVAMLKETVTQERLAAMAGAANESEQPVFIFGMPRSGSSLAEQLIAAHPQAAAGGERPFFTRATARLGMRLTPGPGAVTPEDLRTRLLSLEPGELAPLPEVYLKRLRHHGGDAFRITDKTPHNFMSLWLIALFFPHARYIHTRRDPMATCVSCFTTDLREWHAYTRDLSTLGRYYRLYEELMAHWRAVLPIDIYECDYEALAADPETEAPRLLAAAGLEWDPRCLDFHSTGKLAQTASYEQVRRPIHTERIDAWRRYESHLGPLVEALAAGS